MWQESEASTTAKRPTRVKAALSFPTSPADLSETRTPHEPALQKQLLPIEFQGGQKYQHFSSHFPRYKPGNTKPTFLTSTDKLYDCVKCQNLDDLMM